MTNTAVYLNANGTFDRAAIKAAVHALVEAKREWVDGYTGEAREWWRRRVWKNAVANVRRDAGYQRAEFVTARVVVTYTPEERADLEVLDASAKACPITFTGNNRFNGYSGGARIIRDRARARAVKAVNDAIRASASAMREAA